MTMDKFEGWVAGGPDSADGVMKWGEFSPKTWEEDDVDIRVTHSGVCASDVHKLRSLKVSLGALPFTTISGITVD